jgi:hypothetical protein
MNAAHSTLDSVKKSLKITAKGTSVKTAAQSYLAHKVKNACSLCFALLICF